MSDSITPASALTTFILTRPSLKESSLVPLQPPAWGFNAPEPTFKWAATPFQIGKSFLQFLITEPTFKDGATPFQIGKAFVQFQITEPAFTYGATPFMIGKSFLQLGTPDPAFYMQPDPIGVGAVLQFLSRPPLFVMGAAPASFALDGTSTGFNVTAPDFDMRPAAPPRFDMDPAAFYWTVSAPKFQGPGGLPVQPPAVPFLWDGISALVERYGYRTEVRQFHDATEQRRLLRGDPSGSIAYGLTHLRADESQAARVSLYTTQDGRVLVPAWQHCVRPAAQVVNGDQAVGGDFSNLPDLVGWWVLIWSSPTDYEVNFVADHDDSSLSLVYPVSKTRAAGSYVVVPAVTGTLSPSMASAIDSLEASGQAFTTTIDRWGAA